MQGRVIQGFFLGGAPAKAVRTPDRSIAGRPSHAGRPGAIGAPLPAFVDRPANGGTVAQRFGGNDSFAIDPAQVGLVRNGGKPLPQALLAKMETAFGADFSDVRVHVGPQASRIGALAFTTGKDLYFAPGQYQPDSVKGQQLIGHELAHVIQQRRGRVPTWGSGLVVVQDRALEMEADRLGMRAATGMATGRSAGPRGTDIRSNAVQRSSAPTYGSVTFGKGGRQEAEFITTADRVQTYDEASDKLEHLAKGTVLERGKRSYDGQREIQILRWISTLIFELLEKQSSQEKTEKYLPVEIQAYWHSDNFIYISSNKRSVNNKYLSAAIKTVQSHINQGKYDTYGEGRGRRHAYKLIKRNKHDKQKVIFEAFVANNIKIPLDVIKHNDKKVDLHAERRIQKMIGIDLDPSRLAGVKRPCLVCAYALKMQNGKRPGPAWTSDASTFGFTLEEVIKHAIANGVLTYVARDRHTKKLTTGHDSDSDSGDDTY